MYNGFNCTLDRYRGQHDTYNSVMAGAMTGALFRCTGASRRGFRYMSVPADVVSPCTNRSWVAEDSYRLVVDGRCGMDVVGREALPDLGLRN